MHVQPEILQKLNSQPKNDIQHVVAKKERRNLM